VVQAVTFSKDLLEQTHHLARREKRTQTSELAAGDLSREHRKMKQASAKTPGEKHSAKIRRRWHT